MKKKLESIVAYATAPGSVVPIGCGPKHINQTPIQPRTSLTDAVLQQGPVHGTVISRRAFTYCHEDELAFIQIYGVSTSQGVVRVGAKFSTEGALRAPKYIFEIGDGVDIDLGEITMGGKPQFDDQTGTLKGVYGIKSYQIK